MAANKQCSLGSREGWISAQTREAMERGELPAFSGNIRRIPVQQRTITPTTHEPNRTRSLDQQRPGNHYPDTQSGPAYLESFSNETSLHHTSGSRCLNGLQESFKRRSSQSASVELPHWQPDTEVDECPVCKTKFGWLFRRHHCRKCGRVVCSSCSQHRITIPRRYIVQPSEQILTSSFSLTPASPPDLGSADVVRVCNPCVPDPNLSPPPQPSTLEAIQRSRHRVLHHSQTADSGQQSLTTPLEAPRYRSSSGMGSQQTRLHGLPVPANHSHRNLYAPSTLSSLPSLRADSQSSRQHNNRRSTLSGSTSALHCSPFRNNRPAHTRGQSLSGHSLTQPASAQRSRSRLPIAEEDECPVCGHELPPRDDSDDDAARARHVADCISSYGCNPARTRSVSRVVAESDRNLAAMENASTDSFGYSSPSTGTFSFSSAPVLTSHSSGSSPSAPSSTPIGRGIGPLHRLPRMLEYKSTEKDCSNDLGEQQECIICLEEFQIGNDMARLECLCKFHKRCILDWWQAKNAHSGPGAEIGCPTHVLHT